ncbi:MAG: PAS domain-containing sensor histidine kinase, partial [Tepidisphaeraceae bacterium]
MSILIGWASLTGWGFDVGWLRNPFPGSVTMQRNSAASLVLCGASLVLYAIRGRAARVPRWVKIVRCVGTGAVVLVAGLASAQHLTGTNFGIDQLLGRGSVDFTHFPAGRMGPTTAAGLLLVSLSLLVPRRERGLMEQAAQYLALGALMIASHGLIVYAYRAAGVYETPAYRPMSAYTALGLAALSAGALMARAHAMPVAFLAGRSPTALLTRRLLLGAVVAPPALGLCIGLIARDGGYEHGYGLALLAWVSMVMLSALIWSTSARFQSSDAARRQAEDRVRRSEERLRFALEAAQMVAWEWDPNSDCVVRTGGLDLLLGENAPTPRGPAAAPGRSLDPEAFGAQRFFEMIHPLDRDSVLKAIRASLDDGSEYHVEFRLKRPDGAARWVADHGRVTRDASGRPIRMNGVMLDVTERKLTDQALYRSQKFLHATLNSLTEQVAILDGAGAIVHVNDAWRRFTQDNGLGAAATEGRCGLELCRRLTGGDIAGAGLRRVLSGESFDFRHEYALSTGSVGEAGSSPARWFQISVNRFAGAESGVDSTRLVVTNHDMTETKRAEQERARILERERRLRTEAEAANAAKDQFLAVLSHELRTPLTPVLSTVETMLCDHPAPGADRDALQMVRRNVELEARLIDDLLDLTRIARGKLEISAHAVDVHALIHSTVGICRGDMELKGQDLVLDLNARPHHVRADPARLQQVLWNLLKNAVKFTPEGGHVVIATEEIDGGHTVRISIKDDGMGIEPDVLPRIFEAFEQGERSVTRRFGGLGLGLAISK